jgi:RNA ligase
MIDFVAFPKIPRLYRDCVITEKIDGTNAQVYVTEDGQVLTGSRTRWITPEDDNFGFAAWVRDNADDLKNLGTGQHMGEWWGGKIQRGYGVSDKRFSLFNTSRWTEDNTPKCCSVVPVLYRGLFTAYAVEDALEDLQKDGSRAVPGYPNPEGICVYHEAAGQYFKVLLENDHMPKGVVKNPSEPLDAVSMRHVRGVLGFNHG